MDTRPSTPPTFVVEAEAGDVGSRLDRMLAEHIETLSRSAIQRLIGDGTVWVDGTRAASADGKRKIRGGERVEIWASPPPPLDVLPEDIPLDVVFEDRHVLVLNKPHGLTVHPGSGQPSGTLANALVHRTSSIESVGAEGRPGIVHRLDRDTSGVMVVAKNEHAHGALSAAFADRRVTKVYVACVHGIPDRPKGTIDLPIGRSLRNRTRMAIRHDGGRDATTKWERRETRKDHCVLHCYPRTGRTHQIRVHLRAIGHAIVGDPFYGRRQLDRALGDPRLMLHAYRLGFAHPVGGEPLEFEVPPPEDFARVLASLSTPA